MKQKLFFWIFLPYLASFLAAMTLFMALTANIASDFLSGIAQQQISETARIAANALEPLLSGAKEPADVQMETQALCDALVRGTTVRLTLIDPNGKVLADTQAQPDRMDIHLDRAEVRKALAGELGSDIRTSVSTGIPTAYEAVPVQGKNGAPVAIIRASVPFSEIKALQQSLSLNIALAGTSIALILSLIAFFLARRITRPLLRLHRAAESFSTGKLSDRIPEEGPRELANLARVMNGMAGELDRKLEELGDEKKRAEAILNGITEAIAVVDRKLAILTKNPAFDTLFGGHTSSKNLIAATRNTELCTFADAAVNSAGPLETMISVYGETPRQLRLASARLGNGTAVLVINDLTRLNRLETVRRDFTTNVSHELKTPLTAIRGALETLQDVDDVDEASRKRFLEIAVKGTTRMEGILEDMLSLARVEEEKTRGLDTAAVALDSVIESVTERLKTRIEEGHIAFERSGESGITVNAHRGLLEQAVFNLMDNALKYGSDGRYLGVCTKTNADMAYISVTDHGRGIPERDKPRMFERFYRVDKARSRESGGTGLGLAIVKHIALAHAGSVSFSSTEGKGTIFTLTIPAADTN